MTVKKENRVYNADGHFDSCLHRCATHLAIHQEPEVIFQRWTWIDLSDFDHLLIQMKIFY